MTEKEQLEITAKTVDEAIQIGLSELDVDLDEVEVDVLGRGKAGILGIGSEPARIRLTIRGNDGAAIAREMTLTVMEAMGVEVDVYIVSPEGEQPISLDIRGEDAGLLIGRQGRTLSDIQMIIALLVSKKLEQYTSVTLDVEDYKSRRFEQIRQVARNAAIQVDKYGDPVTLENMNSAERRFVHITLAEDPTVETQSDGRGSDRRVTIYPS